MDFFNMVSALGNGLSLVFQWPSIGFLFVGVLIGIVIGAIPGLGGLIGLFILLPFTYTMDTVPAFALLLGMFSIVTSSDTIASVMLGIPGTAASQATILDGYPMARKGQAARAFGAAFSVSAFGGVFGALVLAVSLPLLMPIILSFSSPEMFMLGILGLTMVGSLSGGSILKGLISALLGLWLSTIGYAGSYAIPRYSFGSEYLIDGLGILPVVLGLFAIPELMDLALKDTSISQKSKDQVVGGSIFDGIRDAIHNWWLVLRCSAIGTYIGMLPGLGAGIVDWLAYGHAVQTTKDNSQFGKGDIRGVIAPEAANNAIKGGVLVPTIAFGIPGGPGAAILLGALLIQGLRPGPEMLTTHLHITFSLVWMIAIANVLGTLLLLLWSKQVTKLAFVPGHLLVPGVVLFLYMGTWIESASMGSWVALLTMGALGFIMKSSGWPRPPIILAIILGNYLENSFQISMRVYEGFGWIKRPVVLVIIAIIIATLIFSYRKTIKRKKAAAKEPSEKERDIKSKRRKAPKNPGFSFMFTAMLFIFFIWMGLESLHWPAPVKQFPLLVIGPAVVLLLFTLYVDAKDLSVERKSAGSMRAVLLIASRKTLLTKALLYFGYLVGVILISYPLGQKLALPLFVVVYMVRWGRYSLRVSLCYAVCAWILLVVFYDQVIHVFWHASWLSTWIPSGLPNWFPIWLFV